MVAPLIGANFILSGNEPTQSDLNAMAARGQLSAYLQHEANALKGPYLIMAGVLILIAIAFIFTKLPEIKESGGGHGSEFSLRVLRIPHVRWAVIAEFFYVGAQVCVTSFFVRFSGYVANIPQQRAGVLLAWAMGGFMAGRFLGTFFMKYIQPAKLLSLYAVVNIGLLLVVLLARGRIAVYALMAIPFFLSIMFPTIFALGIKDLGEETKLASSLLVMSIIGGAAIPVCMAMISDATGGDIQLAYVMPVLCMAVILFFGLRGYRVRSFKPAVV